MSLGDLLAAAIPPGPVCTGLTASWCPIHGLCTCSPDHSYGWDELTCPLHRFDSSHPEATS